MNCRGQARRYVAKVHDRWKRAPTVKKVNDARVKRFPELRVVQSGSADQKVVKSVAVHISQANGLVSSTKGKPAWRRPKDHDAQLLWAVGNVFKVDDGLRVGPAVDQ